MDGGAHHFRLAPGPSADQRIAKMAGDRQALSYAGSFALLFNWWSWTRTRVNDLASSGRTWKAGVNG
jgi:hypothetical protein